MRQQNNAAKFDSHAIRRSTWTGMPRLRIRWFSSLFVSTLLRCSPWRREGDEGRRRGAFNRKHQESAVSALLHGLLGRLTPRINVSVLGKLAKAPSQLRPLL